MTNDVERNGVIALRAIRKSGLYTVRSLILFSLFAAPAGMHLKRIHRRESVSWQAVQRAGRILTSEGMIRRANGSKYGPAIITNLGISEVERLKLLYSDTLLEDLGGG